MRGRISIILGALAIAVSAPKRYEIKRSPAPQKRGGKETKTAKAKKSSYSAKMKVQPQTVRKDYNQRRR